MLTEQEREAAMNAVFNKMNKLVNDAKAKNKKIKYIRMGTIAHEYLRDFVSKLKDEPRDRIKVESYKDIPIDVNPKYIKISIDCE